MILEYGLAFYFILNLGAEILQFKHTYFVYKFKQHFTHYNKTRSLFFTDDDLIIIV